MSLMKKPGCANPLVGAETDEVIMKTTFEILERRNIIGVTSGPLVDRWRATWWRSNYSLAAFGFGAKAPSPATLREWLAAKRYLVFGEVGIQYQGVSPGDPRFEPYSPLPKPRTCRLAFTSAPARRARLCSWVRELSCSVT